MEQVLMRLVNLTEEKNVEITNNLKSEVIQTEEAMIVRQNQIVDAWHKRYSDVVDDLDSLVSAIHEASYLTDEIKRRSQELTEKYGKKENSAKEDELDSKDLTDKEKAEIFAFIKDQFNLKVKETE